MPPEPFPQVSVLFIALSPFSLLVANVLCLLFQVIGNACSHLLLCLLSFFFLFAFVCLLLLYRLLSSQQQQQQQLCTKGRPEQVCSNANDKHCFLRWCSVGQGQGSSRHTYLVMMGSPLTYLLTHIDSAVIEGGIQEAWRPISRRVVQ